MVHEKEGRRLRLTRLLLDLSSPRDSTKSMLRLSSHLNSAGFCCSAERPWCTRKNRRKPRHSSCRIDLRVLCPVRSEAHSQMLSLRSVHWDGTTKYWGCSATRSGSTPSMPLQLRVSQEMHCSTCL